MTVQPLVSNYSPTFKNTARCPHGNPMGACKLCMGGGGALNNTTSKPKPTPKELGLLTWADLLPMWYAMLAAQENAKNNQEFNKFILARDLFNKLQMLKAMATFFNTHIMPIGKKVSKVIIKPVIKTVKKVVQAASNFFSDLKTQMMQQISKMAAINVINKTFKSIFEKLSQLKNASEKFVSFLKEKETAIKDLVSKFSKKVKKDLLSVVQSSFFEKLFG